MMSNQQTAAASNDAQKTAYIQKVIRHAGDQARQRFPWLQQQNLIGGSVMAVSVLGMLLAAWLYHLDMLGWWLCIPLVAILQSLIHELEHDLIHQMYFKDKPWAYNLMLLLCWLTRPSTVSPWLRKELHFHHHKHSGSHNDLEERGITNGAPWGLRRLLMTGDNLAAVWMRPLQTFRMISDYATSLKPANRAEHTKQMLRAFNGYFPVGLMHYALWYSFLAIHGASLLASLSGHALHLSPAQQHWVSLLNFLAVVWLIPSHLRTFSLHFISSNLHYYGDVQERNVMQQCQVLTAWWLAPLQLFCCNFGATHAIHHFVVRDPFYIRQLTAKQAHVAMRAMGVRFNDFGTFRRANRYHAVPENEPGFDVMAAAK
ncbi:MAG: hypothetical protein RL210_2789 [Pseudomonadota bacterium]|jgi:hypothetical protein